MYPERTCPDALRHRLAGLGGIVLLFTLGLAPSTVCAQEITTNFSGAVRFEFDDNRLLVDDNGEELALLTLSPRLTTLFRGPRYDAQLYGGLHYGQSFDEAVEDDRTDFLGGASFTYQWPTSTIELDSNYTERSLREEQFLDTGDTAIDAKQRRFSSSATWTASVSEYTSVILGGGYDRTTQSRNALRDFDVAHVTVGLARELTDRLKLQFNVNAQRLSPDSGVIATTDSVRASLEAAWLLSDYTTLALEAGAIYSDDDIETQTEFVGKAGITHQFDRLDLSLSIARAAAPSSDGTLRITEAATGALAYEILETLSFGANIEAGRTRSLNQAQSLISPLRTRRLSASPRVTWKPRDTLALELSYRRRELDRRAGAGSVGSNAVMLELRIQYPRNQIS